MFTTKINDTLYYVTTQPKMCGKLLAIIEKYEYNNKVTYDARIIKSDLFKRFNTLRSVKEWIVTCI